MSFVFFYIESVVIGLAYGFIAGYIKYAVLWKKILKTEREIFKEALYLRLGIGYAINFAVLLFVFLIRDIMPFDFAVTIISAAVAMSLSGKLAPVNRIFNYVREAE